MGSSENKNLGMKSFEVRESFIKYFERNGHTAVASSSLIPDNDPTLLFTNAGMNQFKNLFLGLEKRPYQRAVSSQKCVRAGGKHNDLENVGFTARHHTFFEMLGNFSFGEYFKKEAIHFAWQFLTEELGLPKNKLYVTVFNSDDEAANIWHKQEGIPTDRIFRFGEKDNFWRMGDTGPCGPCTEIFYDHGPKAGLISDPFKGIESGEDRFVEIWNLVFMQFFEKAPGVMEPLPKPSVDTGSGLERVVAAMQGKTNNYDTDLFAPLIQTACKAGGFEYITDETILKKYPEVRENTAAIRVMADHCRAAGFLLADGAFPSNEGRGYVLRRILRRAIRFGRKLNPTVSIFPSMVEALIQQMSGQYSELKSRKDFILSAVRDEEDRFLHTLDKGTEVLTGEIERAKNRGLKSLPGETLFKLYDTYGFPVDLTRIMASEKGMLVDEASFEEEMKSSKEKSKLSWKKVGIQADEAHLIQIAQHIINQLKVKTNFVGYDEVAATTKILALSDGAKLVNELHSNQSGFVVLERTPFYAEGGGQVGDHGALLDSDFKEKTGGDLSQNISGMNIALDAFNSIESLSSKSKTFFEVINCTKSSDVFIHHVHGHKGTLKVNESIQSFVNFRARQSTCAHHTATHLLHSALRKVLGTHVTQAGSLVEPNRLRFDFNHGKALTSKEIKQIESIVNEQISLSIPVNSRVMTHKAALNEGAMALFGEKYGDEVRVLKIADFSCELCGGTHVKNTSEIRVFKIVSEGSVSSGVRRIEAITHNRAIDLLTKAFEENNQARSLSGFTESWDKYLEAGETDGSKNSRNLSTWIEERKNEIKGLEREIKKLKGAQIDVAGFIKNAKKFGDPKLESCLVWANLDIEDREVLSQVSDQLRDRIKSGIIIVFGKGESSHPTLVSVTADLTKTFPAGNLLKSIAATMGGKGGGRPDFAQGAVNDLTKVAEAEKAILNSIASGK